MLRLKIHMLSDIKNGWQRRANWAYLAYSDLKGNYHRTLLGPLWASVQWALTIIIKGLVFGLLFKVNIAEYLPFLTAGLLTWQWMAGVMTQGVTVFIGNRSIIESITLPLSFHVYRSVFYLFLYYCNHLIVFVAVGVFFQIPVTWCDLLFLPGVAVVYLASLCTATIFGVVGARLRDAIPIVGALVHLGFFVTPIMWQRSMLGEHAWIADFNPLYHYIEIVRAPLLGQAPAAISWYVSGGCTLLLLAVALGIFGKYRSHIPYWL